MPQLLQSHDSPTCSRRTARQWHLAPVITRGGESLDGSRVLEEVDGVLGVLLWQLLRDVRLWTSTPAEDHPFLFAAGAADRVDALQHAAHPSPALAPSVAVLTDVVRNPSAVAGTSVARACADISRLMEAAGHAATALEFAQAAAFAEPTKAPASLEVARLAEALADHGRAETWLRRAVTVARRSADGTTYGVALLWLGRIYRGRRNRRAARRYFLRALRASARARDAETRMVARAELRVLGRRTLPHARDQ
jgi:tetratricopeptide (TPR) repeat protein